MIFLCTDFGFEGPYLGQMKGVAAEQAASCQVIDLIHDLPKFKPLAASYLLAAILQRLPLECIVVAVVDPGVGSNRRAIVLHADQRWLVGPDNGLLDVVAKRASNVCFYEIVYQPPNVSASFHGRDIFMPVALGIFNQSSKDKMFLPMNTPALEQVQAELAEIIYIDGFGNLMTGLNAELHNECEQLNYKGQAISRARTFADKEKGHAFFYQNSQGLLEIAINCGNAQQNFSSMVGDAVSF